MKEIIKKPLKFIAQFFIVWAIIGLASYLSYSLLIKPVIINYEKYGWQAGVFTVLIEMIIYTIIFFIIERVDKIITWAFDKD